MLGAFQGQASGFGGNRVIDKSRYTAMYAPNYTNDNVFAPNAEESLWDVKTRSNKSQPLANPYEDPEKKVKEFNKIRREQEKYEKEKYNEPQNNSWGFTPFNMLKSGAVGAANAVGGAAKAVGGAVGAVGGAAYRGTRFVGGAALNGVGAVGGAAYRGTRFVGGAALNGVGAVGGAALGLGTYALSSVLSLPDMLKSFKNNAMDAVINAMLQVNEDTTDRQKQVVISGVLEYIGEMISSLMDRKIEDKVEEN